MTRPLRIAAIILAVCVLAVAVAVLVGWREAVGVAGVVAAASATRTVRQQRRAGAVRHREEVHAGEVVQDHLDAAVPAPRSAGEDALEAVRRAADRGNRQRGRPR